MIGRINKRVFFKKFVCLVFVNTISFHLPADSLKAKLGILPTAYFTPETNLGFGGMFYTYFKFSKNDTASKRSNTQTYFSYTLNKQYTFENDYLFWLKNNSIYLNGSFDYTHFPEFFYGVSNDTKEHEKMLTSFDLIKIHTKNLMLLKKNVYAGITFHYQKLFNQNFALEHYSPCDGIYGKMGYTAFGIGPTIIIDKRNNPLNPAKGSFVELSLIDYGNTIKNKYKHVSYIIDLRKYYTFFNRLIWNGNLYATFNKGEVPYRMMPEIGGARFLRGYYKGRFRDNNMIVLQQEIRIPVYKRFGIAAFGGIGEVANSLKQFKSNTMHYNYGIGLRVQINKKENTNLRIDYGITKDSQGLYVVFAEAF